MRHVALVLLIATGLLGLEGCARSAEKSASVSSSELLSWMDQGRGSLVLDVRSPEEYASGHVPGAVNIPYAELPDRISELGGPSAEVVVYCESGRRAGVAEEVLRQAGFSRVLHLEGDMGAWREQGLPCTGC